MFLINLKPVKVGVFFFCKYFLFVLYETMKSIAVCHFISFSLCILIFKWTVPVSPLSLSLSDLLQFFLYRALVFVSLLAS